MCWDPFEDNDQYPFLSVLNHFQENGVFVPKVFAKSPKEGYVLLEDLGDLTLERKFWENQSQELTLPFYRQAIDEIVKIHYVCSSSKKQTCTAFRVFFDTEKLLWEMNYARTHLLEGFCGLKFSEKETGDLNTTFHSICSRLNEQPKFIAHRDYHSRNLMLKFGKMRVIDFQDARMGAVQYDLVSLLRDSYVELNEGLATALIDYYLLRRTEFDVPKVNLDQFREIYELQSIQRCFKACGSFSSFYNARRDTRYLKYISKTLVQVRASLMYFKEYKPFLDILDRHGVFQKDYQVS